MIKSKKLSKNKAIKHGFFNSIGGVSKNIYKSLNCGPGSNDNSANVKKNLNIVRKKISKNSKNIFLLNQIHSNKFVFIDKKYKSKIKPKADAIITDQVNLPIAVLTADCVPILIYDRKNKIIGCIRLCFGVFHLNDGFGCFFRTAIDASYGSLAGSVCCFNYLFRSETETSFQGTGRCPVDDDRQGGRQLHQYIHREAIFPRKA